MHYQLKHSIAPRRSHPRPNTKDNISDQQLFKNYFLAKNYRVGYA